MSEPVALIFADKDLLVKGFTEYFMKLLDGEKENFHVALSGGNTPRLWFQYLVDNCKDKINWQKIHFYWGDERCVPPDDEQSNFGMTKSFLLDYIDIPDENIHRIQGELDPETAAKEYEKELNNLHDDQGIPVFDLVILGMGDDGHTASIFPHEIALWNSASDCVVATHPETGQKRVSLSGRVINHANHVAFVVSGISKAEKVMQVIVDQSPQYPATLVIPVDGGLHWFLDREAASFITDDQ